MQHIVIDPSGALASAAQAFVVPDEPTAIGLAIEALLERLDAQDDHEDVPDFTSRSDGLPGDANDAEPNGDEGDRAWVEWHSMRGSEKRGANIASHDEDLEDSESDCCSAADDDPARRFDDGKPGDEADREEDDPSGGNCEDEGEATCDEY